MITSGAMSHVINNFVQISQNGFIDVSGVHLFARTLETTGIFWFSQQTKQLLGKCLVVDVPLTVDQSEVIPIEV